MKKKIVNAFLMMALIASSMGTFVSCKDYDEDAYVDLRNRISNEVSLRETLKKQVDNLEAALNKLKEEAATKEELKAYLTKEEAAKTYVTIAVYNEYITNNDAKITIINNAIKDLEKAIEDIKKDMATKDDLAALAVQIQKANEAASEALGKANEALNLSKENAEKIAELEKIIGNIPPQFDPSTLWEAIQKLQDAIAGIDDKIVNINVRIDSIMGALEGYELRISLLEQNFDSLSQVVNLQGDQILEIQQQIIDLQNLWNNKIEIIVNQAITVSDEAKQLAQDALKKATEALLAAEAANAKASNAEQLALNAFYMAQEACEIAKKLQSDLEEAIKRAEDAAKKAENAQKKAEDAQAECEKILEEIKKYSAAGCDCPKDLEERLQAAENKAELAKNAADAAKALAEALEGRVKTLEDKVKAAEDKDKEQDDSIADLYKKLSEIVTEGCSCGDLKKKVEDLDKEVDDLDKKIGDVDKKVDDLKKDVDDLKKDFDNLKKDVKSMITDIIIQGTENPVLGYINVPLDARSTMLMCYFGKSDNAFAFPAAGGQWVFDDERFTDEDIAIMTGGGSLSSVPGYFTQAGGECFTKEGMTSGQVLMGRVFMTVNPSTIDFSGKTFTLENSQGKQSIVTLSAAAKSDKLLTFGYDRTRADNGFYEAAAYMDINDANLTSLRLSLDIDGLKASAKAALKNKSVSSAVSLLAELYKSIDNQIEANAVKASWTDSEGKEHSVYSNYAIGTTTVKPLSFNTLKIDRLKSWPGKKLIYKAIDKIISQIKIHVPSIDLDKAITFNEVEAKGNEVTVSFNAYVNGHLQTVTLTVTTDSEDITTLQQLEELIYTSEDGEVKVNLAMLINKINNLDDEWEAAIETAKDDMIAGMQKYVDRAYNKANSIFTLYSLLDINLVVFQPGKGFKFCGPTVERATMLSGTANLIPTSNCAEYLAPAYKKYIAISNVYDASTKAPLSQGEAIAKAQAAAGKNFNQVISGDATLTISGEAGYIYEISYAAVDYHGMKTRQTFYVQF